LDVEPLRFQGSEAALLGSPRWAFISGMVLVSALMAWGLSAYLQSDRNLSHSTRPP